MRLSPKCALLPATVLTAAACATIPADANEGLTRSQECADYSTAMASIDLTNPAGTIRYAALPRTRSAAVVVRFNAKGLPPGGYLFKIKTAGLKQIVAVPGFDPAAQTWMVTAGQDGKAALALRGKLNLAGTLTRNLATRIVGVGGRCEEQLDEALTWGRPTNKLRIDRLSGGKLESNSKRVFTGTVGIAVCTRAQAGTPRVHIRLPDGRSGLSKAVVKVSRSTVEPRICRLSAQVQFKQLAPYAGGSISVRFQSAKKTLGTAGRSNTIRVRVAR